VRAATRRRAGATQALTIDGDIARVYDAPDAAALVAEPERWRVVGEEDAADLDPTSLAPVVPHPSKIVCLGLNYAAHITEMGRELPSHPTLFAKYQESLIGPNDPIVLPRESDSVDWEGELVVVVGTPVRRADDDEAAAAIAGFAVGNDVTARDFQRRTLQWLQGKTWEATTPVGPFLVTPDEVGGQRPALDLVTRVNGSEMQRSTTGDLVFDPVDCVRYVSTIIRLRPGDLIFTGTPAGVGDGRDPKVFLEPGDLVEVEIDGIGTVSNRCVEEAPA
jgi:acylpyruvate hydrolase